MLLDSAGRETCTVRQSRTNTPLQALAMMNEVTFVEAARMLAEYSLRQPISTGDDPLRRMFARALGRSPTDSEMAVLRRVRDDQQAHFSEHPSEADALLSVGESTRDTTLDPIRVAAHAVVANMILNLDEFVTKE
jgi:hypothetical protein